ncbi:MAG: hypothetical protein JSU07_09610 [Bacteroidetes bacterium]|nr:hypothetical protein [Bacteroidota bacterium]
MKFTFYKIFFTVLFGIYFFASIGVNVITHYCDGKAENATLYSETTSCCSETESTEDTNNNDCCKNESKFLSLQNEFTHTKNINSSKLFWTQLYLIIVAPHNHSLTENLVTVSYIINSKFRPPNLIQPNLIAQSVMRI